MMKKNKVFVACDSANILKIKKINLQKGNMLREKGSEAIEP